MTLRRDPGADCRLYLEDLHVGQRFVSRSHAIDKEQIKAFAAQFDPQAFHLDDEAAKTTLFGGDVERLKYFSVSNFELKGLTSGPAS